jgi:hypothetical protein
VHCGNIRQTARILEIVDRQERQPAPAVPSTSALEGKSKEDSDKVIRTGDRAIVKFRFLQHPEYLKNGARILFREGRTKGVGKVTRILCDA